MVDEQSLAVMSGADMPCHTPKNLPTFSVPASHFATPRGNLDAGRLVFASPAANLHLHAATRPGDLCAAEFVGHLPGVQARAGIVTVRYPHQPHALDASSLPSARISLNATVPWEVEFRGGLTCLTADLRAIQVVALDMLTVSMAHFSLATPADTATTYNIYVAGSASNLTLLRPAGVALRLQVAGAASHVVLDDQRIHATTTPIHWQSANYATTRHRYAVSVAGSVSHLTVGYSYVLA